MKILVACIMLFLASTSCAGGGPPGNTLCEGVSQQLPEKSFSDKLITTLGQQVFQKEKLEAPIIIVRIDQYMRKDEWHILWATPENMERGIFLLRGDAKDLEYVAVWGGIAFPEEEPEVLEWFKQQAPSAPISLIRCAARAITREGW